jgi:hypothetical protein
LCRCLGQGNHEHLFKYLDGEREAGSQTLTIVRGSYPEVCIFVGKAIPPAAAGQWLDILSRGLALLNVHHHIVTGPSPRLYPQHSLYMDALVSLPLHTIQCPGCNSETNPLTRAYSSRSLVLRLKTRVGTDFRGRGRYGPSSSCRPPQEVQSAYPPDLCPVGCRSTSSSGTDGAMQRGDQERIPFLSQVRNKPLEPLWNPVDNHRREAAPWPADRVLYMNDVHVCAADFVRLMLNPADMVCGLDFWQRNKVHPLRLSGQPDAFTESSCRHQDAGYGIQTYWLMTSNYSLP